MASNPTNLPTTRTRRTRVCAIAALLAFVLSWTMGAAHLASHNHYGHVDSAAWAHECAVDAQDGLQSLSVQGDGDDRPVASEAELAHECAILGLWSNLTSTPTSSSAWTCSRWRARLGDFGNAAVGSRKNVPIYLVAPKNSPPSQGARAVC